MAYRVFATSLDDKIQPPASRESGRMFVDLEEARAWAAKLGDGLRAVVMVEDELPKAGAAAALSPEEAARIIH